MVSFNSIPANLRSPANLAEFDNSRAAQGPALMAIRALLIGQKLNSGSGTENTLRRVTNADQVLAVCGRGSILHRAAKAFFVENKSTETWIGILADNAAAAFATGSLTVTGPATASGTLHLYVGGLYLPVGVSAGDSANTVAAAIAAKVGKHASGTVTFASATTGDNITVGATTFVATSGSVTPGAATYSIDTGNSNAAASFVAQVKAHAVAGKKVYASALSAVATLRAIEGGAVGEEIVLTSVDGVTTAVTGSGTLTGSTPDTDAAVHASASSAVVTLYARNAGAVANELDVRCNHQNGEEFPAGVSVAVTAMSGGTTNPTLTSLISEAGDMWFHVVANPYTDATSLTALETEFSSRFGPTRAIDGNVYAAKNDSYATVAALGASRNSPHSTIVRTNSSPTAPEEFAASVAGVVARYSPVDPARPLQTLPLTYVLAPKLQDRETYDERNLLLFDGISTVNVTAGDQVQIDRLITTYQTNSSGADDSSYLDVETLHTLAYLRYSWTTRLKTRFPRHKLGSDGAQVGSGQAVITPQIGKAEAVAWFQQMQRLGLVEGLDQFKRDLVTERNATDVNGMDWLLPPDLINKFVVGRTKFQFGL